jgi:hypothetical protein
MDFPVLWITFNVSDSDTAGQAGARGFEMKKCFIFWTLLTYAAMAFAAPHVTSAKGLEKLCCRTYKASV